MPPFRTTSSRGKERGNSVTQQLQAQLSSPLGACGITFIWLLEADGNPCATDDELMARLLPTGGNDDGFGYSRRKYKEDERSGSQAGREKSLPSPTISTIASSWLAGAWSFLLMFQSRDAFSSGPWTGTCPMFAAGG